MLIEGLWVIVGQGISIIGSLALLKLLTYKLGPEEYGNLMLWLTMIGFISQLLLGGLTAATGRYYSVASELKELNGYFKAVKNLLSFLTTLIVLGSVIGCIILFNLDYKETTTVVIAALAYAIFVSWKGVFNAIQNAARQRKIVAFHTALDTILKFLLIYYIFIDIDGDINLILIVYAGVSFMVLTSHAIFLKKFIRVSEEDKSQPKNWTPRLIKYSIPVSIWGAFIGLYQISDRWSLETFTSTKEVGYYSILFQLGYTPIALIAGATLTFIAPILYQNSGDASNISRVIATHKLCWRITYTALIITLAFFSGSFFIHEWVFSLIVSRSYVEVSYLWPWMILAGGLFAASQVLNMKIEAELNPALMTTIKISTTLIGIVFNILGAYLYGLQGVVVALVCYSIIYFLWMSRLGTTLESMKI